MKSKVVLRLQELEPRRTPVAGIPWPDAGHLTLSFAPDGTSVDGQTSSLQSLLAGAGPSAELQILEAYQTWVNVSNINVGLVSDSGAQFGIGRDVQGDPRFGDIRLGAISLSGDVGALTSPFNYLSTESGESVLNAGLPFSTNGASGTYDLQTVSVHEAGHALGLDVNQDTASVEYEYYQGIERSLGTSDVAAIQGLYGARVPDQYEGSTGNDTPATATPYTQPLTADISSSTDRDVYKFQVNPLTNGIKVQLVAAGLSLLTAKLEVLDSQGNVVQSAMATDPTNNNLTISLSNFQAGQTYYVRVSSGSPSLFAVGSYQLGIVQSSPATAAQGGVGSVLQGSGANSTLATATLLTGRTVTSVGAAVLPQTQYDVHAGFGSSKETDYYRIAAPAGTGTSGTSLVVVLWGQNGLALNGWTDLEDGQGNSITGRVLVANGNTTIVQWTGLTAGQALYFRVDSLSGTTGNYTLSANFTNAAIALPHGGSGGLTAAAPATSNVFTVPQTGQIHFVLQTLGSAGSTDLVLLNSSGAIVSRITAKAGFGVSEDLFLPAGTYTVQIVESGTPAASPVNYEFGMVLTTDPIGTKPVDSTGAPAQSSNSNSSPSGGSTSSSGSSSTWQGSGDASDASWY